MRNFDFSPLYRSAIGFDRLAQLFDAAQVSDAQPSYPPYNIELMAEAEQLFAHRNAVALRLKN